MSASLWGSVQCPTPAKASPLRILLHLLHIQVLRPICIYVGSQNRVIGTAPLFAPGSACLLTVALTCSLLQSTTALYYRRAVSSRYTLSDETYLMLTAGQHTCWNSGKCVQHHPVRQRYCLSRVCVRSPTEGRLLQRCRQWAAAEHKQCALQQSNRHCLAEGHR